MQLRDEKGDHFTLGEAVRTDLSEMDVVLLRQDPPFDMDYITTTHILERIHPKTLVVNDPAWVRNSPEKIFVTEFADLMPETLITKDRDEIAAFRKEFGDIILKPLYGNGGAGVFHLARGRPQSRLAARNVRPDVPRALHRAALSAGRAQGRQAHHPDRRRAGRRHQPRAGRTRCALQHACRRPRREDRADRRASSEICARIGPALKERGFILVGIDVIGDYMTEINVTSPTGIREVKRFGGADIAALFWDAVEAKRG